MFSTDNLFFLILFIVPGAVYLLFNRYLRLTPHIEKDGDIRIAGAFFFSMVVFFINIILFGNDYLLFTEQSTIFDNIPLLMKLTGLNIGMAFACSFLWALLGLRIITVISNVVNFILKRPQSVTNEILWDEIFETNKLITDKNEMVVSIEKDGMLTYGIIRMFTSSITERKEFILQYSSEIEAYFKRDEDEKEADKVFPKKTYVYLDIDSGLKITFYDTKRYRAWVNESTH